MKQSTKIAKNYALALSELAGSSIQLQENFLSEITEINNALKSLQDAKKILENPSIPKEEKKKFVETLRQGISITIINFLYLLIDNKRFNLLPAVQDELVKLINKARGIIIAEVHSPQGIDTLMINTILGTLRQNIFKDSTKEIKIKQKVDPSLIGGIKIKINGLVYDGSIKGRLESLKRRLG